ncbi:MAG: ATP phosphoribosyltransferase regulatory subunit [Clostridia bacterium]|nr:ATP phosphoribosyltransferase regulatory subunit [Clostridia bacterium]
MENFILKNEERAVFALRSLYRQYGYLPYKMSKFEEYDLYVRNKDFLVSDSVITFNDTNGRLLALKPDVTLSIIKNSVTDNSYKQKLYYNENVYRISESTHQYKEIMQTGIECI